jgi:hypothetical protein
VSGESLWRRAEGVVTCSAEDEVSLLVRETWGMVHLNQTAQRLWELLQEPMTTEAVVERLVHEFDIDPRQCRADVVPALMELRAAGAVEGGNEDP